MLAAAMRLIYSNGASFVPCRQHYRVSTCRLYPASASGRYMGARQHSEKRKREGMDLGWDDW